MSDGLARMSVRLLYPFGAVLSAEGVPLHELLSSAGMSAQEYADPNARVTNRVAAAFVAAALDRTKHRALGLKAAERHDFAQFHLLEYVAASSPSVSAALTGLVRYQGLLSDYKALTLEPRDGGLLLRYTRPGRGESRCVLEYVIGGLARAALRVGDVAALPRQPQQGRGFAWFDYPEPDCVAEYCAFFHGGVRFGMPANGIWIPASRIDAKLARANSRLLELLEPQVQESIAKIPGARTFSDQVHTLLAKSLPTGVASLAVLADKVHVSPSTLKRKLAAEGASYSTILESVRRRAALSCLQRKELTLHEVSYLLGYEDLTSFHKAFKRWTGTSPGEYRARTKEQR